MARPRNDRRGELLRAPPDQIVEVGHSLIRPAEQIDYDLLDGRFGFLCEPGSGQPGVSMRLGAGIWDDYLAKLIAA